MFNIIETYNCKDIKYENYTRVIINGYLTIFFAGMIFTVNIYATIQLIISDDADFVWYLFSIFPLVYPIFMLFVYFNWFSLKNFRVN